MFVAQVDFDETGQVMADMALDILGDDGGQMAILSASPDAANQNAWIAAFNEVLANDPTYANIKLVDTVYGNDQSEESYNQALALVDKHPDLELIMARPPSASPPRPRPCRTRASATRSRSPASGCPTRCASTPRAAARPEFALWSFVDLGYLTYYATYGIATGQIEAAEGRDVQRRSDGHVHHREGSDALNNGLRIVMGPFTVYDESNVGVSSSAPATT